MGRREYLPGLPVRPLAKVRLAQQPRPFQVERYDQADADVIMRPSQSFPLLRAKNDNGNLSRVTLSSRLESLQRQFESAGHSAVPLPRRERSRLLMPAVASTTRSPTAANIRALGEEERAAYIEAGAPAYDILYYDEHQLALPSSASPRPDRNHFRHLPDVSAAPPAVLVVGSETSLTELRLAEAVAQRRQSLSLAWPAGAARGANGADERSARPSAARHLAAGHTKTKLLELCSGRAAQDGLQVLRQLAASLEGQALGRTLSHVAEALEPILLSQECMDGDAAGAALTHEQLVETVLNPKLEDARAREKALRSQAAAAEAEARRYEGRLAALQRALDATAPQLRSTEARKSSLEIELEGARREFAALVAENKQLQDHSDGQADAQNAALIEENRLLRDTNTALLQQAAHASQGLQESVPRADYDRIAVDLRVMKRDYRSLELRAEAQAVEVRDLRDAVVAAAAGPALCHAATSLTTA